MIWNQQTHYCDQNHLKIQFFHANRLYSERVPIIQKTNLQIRLFSLHANVVICTTQIIGISNIS